MDSSWKLILPEGEIVTPDMFTKEAIEATDNDTLGYLDEEIGRIASFKRKTDATIKQRLDEGQLFSHYEFNEKTKWVQVYTDLANGDQAKYDLVTKYGWNVVQFKPIEELQKMHGDVITPDLEKLTELEEKTSRRISMK